MTISLYSQQVRLKMVETAKAMLFGGISFIEGARQINRLRHEADIENFDPDIIPFDAIDSETDALPLGDVRRHRSPDALVKLQPEIDGAEKWARDYGRDACAKLILRFGARPLGKPD